jgi:hypothetical protein
MEVLGTVEEIMERESACGAVWAGDFSVSFPCTQTKLTAVHLKNYMHLGCKETHHKT